MKRRTAKKMITKVIIANSELQGMKMKRKHVLIIRTLFLRMLAVKKMMEKATLAKHYPPGGYTGSAAPTGGEDVLRTRPAPDKMIFRQVLEK